MRRLTGVTALTLLGALSAVVYATAVPVAGWLGLEPLAAHAGVFATVFVLYLAAIPIARRGVRPAPGALAVVLGFGLLFRVLMLPTPVYLSSDLYRYLWDGRVQLAGVSPYRYAPAAPELAPLRDRDIYPHINRPGARTVYPPGSQWLFALAAVVTPRSIVGWRVMLLAVEAATVVLLLRWLRRLGVAETAVLVYVWSPLVVFEGVQAGHVDLALIPVVLLALTWRQDRSSARAGVALGLAALMKLYPAALVLAWRRPGDWRFPAALAATVAAGYLPYVARHGAGALGFLPEYFGSREDHNVGLRALVAFPLGLTAEPARGVVMASFFALMAGALLWIGRGSRPDAAGAWRSTALAIFTYLLLVPTSMHPWYVLWAVPFLCAAPPPGWLYFSGAVTLSYVKYVVEPAPFPWWIWVGEYLPLYGLLAVDAWRSRTGRPAAPLARPTT